MQLVKKFKFLEAFNGNFGEGGDTKYTNRLFSVLTIFTVLNGVSNVDYFLM